MPRVQEMKRRPPQGREREGEEEMERIGEENKEENITKGD